MADVSMILVSVLTFASSAVIFAVSVKIAVSSNWYKAAFARAQGQWAQRAAVVFQPVREKLFADLKEHLKVVSGDVLEIGIGSGTNFYDYPEGTSLIAVDSNPHVEKLLMESLKRAENRVHLKKFVAASAEDMRCTGNVGLQDNSVAAVVCTKLLCSLTDEQVRKALEEVKRVLMPGGRFFFMEHVAGKPWTLQYVLQCLVSKSRLWPTLFNGCRCDRETLAYIEQGGFEKVQAEKRWLTLVSTKPTGSKPVYLTWNLWFSLQFVSSLLVGFAEKGRVSGDKKQL